MAAPRFRDDGRTRWQFCGHMLLVCPQCGGCAVSAPVTGDARAAAWTSPRALACGACGYATRRRPQDRTPVRLALGHDDYFRLPYWLQVRCRGGLAHAANEEQLAYLEAFFAARLRERRRGAHGWINQSYLSRLPAWMKAAKNRAEVLHAIRRLKARLAGR
jgi:hypothetical protein